MIFSNSNKLNISVSNVIQKIKEDGTSFITIGAGSNITTGLLNQVLKSSKYYNGKNVYISNTSPLYPGIIGTVSVCPLLGNLPVNIIDGNKLSGEGAKMYNNAKFWHNHTINVKNNINLLKKNNINLLKYGTNNIYELVYYENTYFYRIKGIKAPEIQNSIITYTKIENDVKNEKITYTSSYTINKLDNTGLINNENITNKTINNLIENDIYLNVIIVLNINKNLCSNKSICYLKFDIIENQYFKIYKTIYVKYYNSTGLLSKQLINFTMATSQEKDILKNGSIRITAYQLSDCSDTNPYIVGTFKISNLSSKTKITTLYRFLEINDVYQFTFDKINIYPTSITGETYKLTNNYLSIYDKGNILNGESIYNKIYSYIMDYNYISTIDEYLRFDIKSFVINIDNNEVWDKYHNFYCNITVYLKNGKIYVLPNLLFNKLGKQLILNEVLDIKELKSSYKDIIKFSITSISGSKSEQKEKITTIKLSTQGNIINN